jgi:hypothetical protein
VPFIVPRRALALTGTKDIDALQVGDALVAVGLSVAAADLRAVPLADLGTGPANAAGVVDPALARFHVAVVVLDLADKACDAAAHLRAVDVVAGV